ncbi:MAG TPA: phosphohydrolase [Spirochaetota bacterium]|nr:phosphohydrolase [Spirochaetota bacterium]HPN82673.1 phosphohydrolase [Spirochaetota bacterium]
MKSPKEKQIENRILELVTGRALTLAEMLFADKEIETLQEYANTVSINRMNFNDHGPVHMKTVARNALVIAGILHRAGIAYTLEREGDGDFEDVQMILLLASLLHDIGMTVGREEHERMGVILSLPILDRILSAIEPDLPKKIAIRSITLECIAGHMASRRIHTLEAGTVLIADGCDMKKGRARIPMILNNEPKPGDIHQYSAAAIEDVSLEAGTRKPLRITVSMTSSVGFFQVEEVLFPKINSSTVKPHVELLAGLPDEEPKCYL